MPAAKKVLTIGEEAAKKMLRTHRCKKCMAYGSLQFIKFLAEPETNHHKGSGYLTRRATLVYCSFCENKYEHEVGLWG